MTIGRVHITNYLSTQFSNLAAAVGQDADPAVGYAPDVDEALRKLGISEDALETATLADADRDVAFALAEYAAARRFWRQLSARVNTSIGGNSFTFGHLLPNAKLLMEDAAEKLSLLGIDVAGAWSAGYMNLDWSEPPLATLEGL